MPDLPQMAAAPPTPPATPAVPPSPAQLRACQHIGRLTLWCVTGLLVLSGLGALTSLLWLLSAGAAHPGFLLVHRWVIGGALGMAFLTFIVLFVVHRFVVPPRACHYHAVAGARVHVGLTAYDDEACIGAAVVDFKQEPAVHRVIVVENNSHDRTREVAAAAGADAVVTEPRPGYGACCQRALAEAAAGLEPTDVIVLCEGDGTFTARDVPKLLAYIENCDLVLGTRATQELRDPGTQMDWLINPANQIVAKLIQCRFWGVRLTDVGCTYRAMRVDAYRRLRDRLQVQGNHFSPHMFIEALQLRMRVIEVPVVFRKRGGLSKGVGSNKLKAARVALSMLGLLYRA